MKYRIILLVIIGVFLIGHVYAWNFEIGSSGGGTGTTVINNFTVNSTNVVHNDLDGLQGGVSGEYYHIRASWYNTLNSDINDWITDSVSSLTHYYTKTESDAINTSVNNYIASVIGSETNWNANYSQFLLNNESLTNYINSNNDSLVNYILYVNSTNGEGQVDTFIANYSQFLLNNESLTNYIAENNQSVINYIALVNTSMKNYVDSLSSYDDTWINSTIDNKILEQNNSLVNYILIQNNSLINYYLEQNGSLINYIAVVNESMKNYVDYQISLIGNYDDSWINSTIDNKISTNNASVVNWANSIFATISALSNYVEISNIVNLVGNWSADKTSYYTSSQIEGILANGSFADTDTFVANYSTFLTHITYDDVMNGTLKDYFDGLYIGIGTETESKWNANYSTFLLNNISITNALNTKLGISQWNATNTSYALLTELNNGSYLNVDTNIGNWTADKSSYTLLSVLNNGSYLNPEGTDTFIGNYSTFLTHITYDDVMNGTLKDYFDGLYIGIGTETEDKWNANYSTFLSNNESITNTFGLYTTLDILNNGSYLNPDAVDTFIANYSTFLTHITYDDVMNGTLKTYFDGLYIGIGTETEDKWNANYSQFLLNNESLTNYIESNNQSLENYILYVNSTNGEGTSYEDNWINGTIDNKIEVQNTSIVNWANSIFATIVSLADYVKITDINDLVGNWSADVTNALAGKLSLSGGTMTGNISLSNSGVRLTNGTQNTAVIYHNGTGWIIRG